jgi:hypothetical protein
MLPFLTLVFVILQVAFAAPVANTATAAAATVGKIRGVRDPIFHLYLQANPKNGTSTAPMQFHLSFLSRSLSLTSPSIHPRAGPRIYSRHLHHNAHNPIAENAPLPQHPSGVHKLQAARVEQHSQHDSLGPRGRHNHHDTGE